LKGLNPFKNHSSEGITEEESKRGGASLTTTLPLPLMKEKGDTGGWG